MTRIRVTTDKWHGGWKGMEFDAVQDGNWWRTPAGHLFLPDEVRVLGRHEGEYDPNHWGEKDPDAYDRQGYALGVKGKHLRDDWSN